MSNLTQDGTIYSEANLLKENFPMADKSSENTENFPMAEKSENVNVVSYEDVIKDLGRFGKFQFIQLSLCSMCYVFGAFMLLGFVFIGYTPPHVCKSVNETEVFSRYGLQNDSTASVSYDSCHVTVSSNISGIPRSIDSFSCPHGRRFIGGKHLTLVSQWDLVCESMGQAELGQTLFIAGQIVGGFIVPSVADRFGRKIIMVVCVTLCTAVEFSITFAPNIYVIWALLAIDGFIYIGYNSCVFVLGLEYLQPKQRGNFGVGLCIFWVACILNVGLFGYIFRDLGWRYFQAAGALTGLICLLYPFFLCESPRWLAAKNHPDKALGILKKACHLNGIDFEPTKKKFKEYMQTLSQNSQNRSIMNASEEQHANNTIVKSENQSLLNLFKHKHTFLLLCISWYIWITHNVTYYGIFMVSSSLSGDRFVNFCALSIVELPSNILVLYLLRRIGRLQVIRIFLLIAAVSLLASSVCIPYSDKHHSINSISTVLFIVGKFSITASFTTIFLYSPETFPTVVRSSAFGACKSMSRIGSLMAPYFRPLYNLVPWAPGVIFAGMCVIALVITPILPETKDQNLPTTIEEMHQLRRKRKIRR